MGLDIWMQWRRNRVVRQKLKEVEMTMSFQGDHQFRMPKHGADYSSVKISFSDSNENFKEMCYIVEAAYICGNSLVIDVTEIALMKKGWQLRKFGDVQFEDNLDLEEDLLRLREAVDRVGRRFHIDLRCTIKTEFKRNDEGQRESFASLHVCAAE